MIQEKDDDGYTTYKGGNWKTFEESFGGGVYQDLPSWRGVDYGGSELKGIKDTVYRPIKIDISDVVDKQYSRLNFEMNRNYAVRSFNSNRWFNYTRDFPEEETYYNVIGSFRSEYPIRSTLSIVTSDPTEEDQTLDTIGSFRKNPSSIENDSDEFQFIPLRDDDGQLSRVKLKGISTIRLYMNTWYGDMGSTDIDYIAFVKSKNQEPNVPIKK